MIKSGQIAALARAGFHYITAVTKPQIERLIKAGVLQLSLFMAQVCEVEHDGLRYLVRAQSPAGRGGGRGSAR